MKDYYAILGVSPSASAAEIQRVFRRLALEFHPDVNSSTEAAARFQEINDAYQILKDPEKRAEYDESRNPWAVPRTGATANQQDIRRHYFQRRVRAATDPGSTWNYYDMLGVPENAPEETIVRAYQRLYREFYAGRSHDPGTAAILQEIVDALDVLADPSRRLDYDRLPADQQQPGRPRQQPLSNENWRTRWKRSAATGGRKPGCLAGVIAVPLLAVSVSVILVLPM